MVDTILLYSMTNANVVETQNILQEIIDPQNGFNSFEFWRTPLPDISLNEFLTCDFQRNQDSSLTADYSSENSAEYLKAYVIIDSKTKQSDNGNTNDDPIEHLTKDAPRYIPSNDSINKTDTIDSNHSIDNDYLKIFEGNSDDDDVSDSSIHNLSANIEHIKKQVRI